jgi:phosphohistidine phosphatase
MQFIFFRHALAMDRTESVSKGIGEADRPILKEGREKTKKTAELLMRLGISPEEIVSSPFARAADTAEILKKSLGFEGKVTFTEDLQPERNFTDFLNYLKHRKSLKDTTVFVGHEPNLSHLISSCLGGKKTFIEIKKSGFAVVEIENLQDVPAGNGKLLTLVGPKITD